MLLRVCTCLLFPLFKPALSDMSSQGQWTLDRLWLISVLKLLALLPAFLTQFYFKLGQHSNADLYFFMSLCNMSRYSCYVLKGSRDHGKPGIRGFKWPCLMSRELWYLLKIQTKNVVILRFIIYIFLFFVYGHFLLSLGQDSREVTGKHWAEREGGSGSAKDLKTRVPLNFLFISWPSFS